MNRKAQRVADLRARLKLMRARLTALKKTSTVERPALRPEDEQRVLAVARELYDVLSHCEVAMSAVSTRARDAMSALEGSAPSLDEDPDGYDAYWEAIEDLDDASRTGLAADARDAMEDLWFGIGRWTRP